MNISSSDLIDAKLEEHQFCGSKQCPGCGHKLEGKPDWVGLPAGVKFDPTDQELIEHLEAKVEAKNSNKSHPLIDEFIPTIEGEDGICYTHPEKLPGVTRDGLSRHFFHRPSKAYTTGTRKRRKIQMECDLQGGETRWHKTGKTRPVMVNQKQKGCKKILVLYTNFGKNRKPEKTNWVMHQYHLGQLEEEREGELVVSKIFFQTQPRQCNWSERAMNNNIHIEGVNNIYEKNNVSRRESGSGSGSCSSSKEITVGGTATVTATPTVETYSNMRDEFVGAVMSNYNPMDQMQHFKGVEQFSFIPYRKSFGEVGTTTGEGSLTCDTPNLQRQHQQQQMSLENHQQHYPHQHHVAETAYHVSRPSHAMSSNISPSPLRHTSIILDDDSFHVSRMMENFPQQQHHKIGGRSASGLEELIMGCTPSSSADVKEECSITNPQETDWLKYSTYWPDPDHHV
ncbi:unnamed protein product [Lactuca virosa]|uniref:NAC domain-containing protein n=1 Tax=Lactuca virosa TaxID=75947 RepID=A0AAU9PFL7_9ASTR|nr:unnamed protein product [Lactuca virosa]